MFNTLLIATAAGVLGTGLGGVLGLVFSKSSKQAVSFMLAFAAGVMVSISCFDLIPEALALSGIWFTVGCIIAGVGAVQLLNTVIDRLTDSKETHVQMEELRHQKNILADNGQRSMLKSGLVMLSAIALHNLPEGMAIGASSVHNERMGLVLAILIALHNIPEGMSIAVPLMEGGMNRWHAVGLTAISGAPTLVGGLIGAYFGAGGDQLVAGALSLAAGAMLYVTFCEIFPQVILLNNGRRPALFSIAGVLFGLIMVNVLH